MAMNPVAPSLVKTGAVYGGHGRSVVEAGRCGLIVAGVAVLHLVVLAAVLHGRPIPTGHEQVRVITATLISPGTLAMPNTLAAAPVPHPASSALRHVRSAQVSRPPSIVPRHVASPPLAVSTPLRLPALAPPLASRDAPEPSVTEPAAGSHGSDATQRASEIVTPRLVAHLDCAMVKPDYPPRALSRGEAGTVVVELETDLSGRVSAAHVSTSSGHPQLDEAARNAVLASHCRPYVENGTPVPARADVPVAFNLDE
jgi:periplasmic protein TonB